MATNSTQPCRHIDHSTAGVEGVVEQHGKNKSTEQRCSVPCQEMKRGEVAFTGCHLYSVIPSCHGSLSTYASHCSVFYVPVQSPRSGKQGGTQFTNGTFPAWMKNGWITADQVRFLLKEWPYWKNESMPQLEEETKCLTIESEFWHQTTFSNDTVEVLT